MCGLPFAGKSFNGEKIAEIVGAEFIAYDRMWQQVFNETGKDPSWEELSVIIQQKIAASLVKGKSIVYDTLNDTKDNRDYLRELASENGAEAQTVYLNTPTEVIAMRRKDNKVTKVRHDVADDKFNEAVERFESPIGEQNVIEILPETNLSEVFRRE
jgi:predicted kinase